MKKHLSSKILFSLLFAALFFACKNEVDYNDVEKKAEPQLPDISTAYTTPQTATKVYFYKQNENGDPDLSTYKRDSSSDITSTSIPAGTRISQLNSLKSYKGFTFYTATQFEDVLNVYFSRNKVTYEFYTSKATPRLLYKKTGLYEAKVTPPSYTPQEDALVLGWEDSDGNLLGTTYDDSDKQYFPRLLENAIGTKTVPDTIGDILLDDGSVISYGTFCAKSKDEQAEIAIHAFGVLVLPNYNEEEIATTPPAEGDDDKEFYYKNIGNETARKSITSGSKKLIAAVFKKNDSLYNSVPWLSNNDSLLKASMSLTNYFDGRRDIAQLKNFDLKYGDFMQGINAFSASESYGSKYCADTIYADGWHLPSIGELGVFCDNISSWFIEYNTMYDYFYKTDGNPIWTSNASDQPYDSSAIYERNTKKSWTAELNYMSTKEKARDENAYVIPFLICD